MLRVIKCVYQLTAIKLTNPLLTGLITGKCRGHLTNLISGKVKVRLIKMFIPVALKRREKKVSMLPGSVSARAQVDHIRAGSYKQKLG
jgi:hypothetical protein